MSQSLASGAPASALVPNSSSSSKGSAARLGLYSSFSRHVPACEWEQGIEERDQAGCLHSPGVSYVPSQWTKQSRSSC